MSIKFLKEIERGNPSMSKNSVDELDLLLIKNLSQIFKSDGKQRGYTQNEVRARFGIWFLFLYNAVKKVG